MMHRMPGQLDSSRPRKRKSTTEVKGSKKASASRRRLMRSSKTHTAAENSSVVSGYGKADGPLERLSRISCECHQTADRRRCSASPEIEGQEGKENDLRMGLGLDSCRVNGVLDKQESEDMEFEETGKSIYPDDDSNQILPVEQFFGNLDAVQDFPQRSSANSACVPREIRRRHYYAPEDSDEEELDFSRMQRDDRADTEVKSLHQ